MRRTCLLKLVIKGKIEVTRRRGRRRKQPLDDLKEDRGYCKFEEEELFLIVGKIAFKEAMDLS